MKSLNKNEKFDEKWKVWWKMKNMKTNGNFVEKSNLRKNKNFEEEW